MCQCGNAVFVDELTSAIALTTQRYANGYGDAAASFDECFWPLLPPQLLLLLRLTLLHHRGVRVFWLAQSHSLDLGARNGSRAPRRAQNASIIWNSAIAILCSAK